jgi:hypothetical protein
MNIERKEEIKQESKRRLNEWLKNSTFNKMSVYGSFIRFNMSIGLNGYPFEKPEWMKDKKFDKFITDEEFHSVDYNKIMYGLFELAQSKSRKIKQ